MLARASSAPRNFDRLATRRRQRRHRARIALLFFLLLLSGAAVYGLRQPAVRISHIVVIGGDESLSNYATTAMQGEYFFGLIPRDSFFFIPEGQIRRTILAEHPEFAAVSISRLGLSNLSITISERTAVARWCLDTDCYVFDPNGFIFEPASTSTPTLNSFLLYSPLVASSSNPIRATLTNADQFPSTFDFARRISSFGSPVTKIVIRDSEVDDYLVSGTRITYVLGDEQNAITALVSANDGLNLADGSLEYVDLRFDGKVYLKKKQ